MQISSRLLYAGTQLSSLGMRWFPVESRTYKLDPALLPQEETKVLKKSLPIVVLAVLAGGGFAAYRNATTTNDPIVSLVPMFVVGILLTFIIIRTVRTGRQQVRALWESFELRIDDERIISRSHLTPEKSIALSQISKIEDVPSGWLMVHGANKNDRISIPKTLQGYSEVVEALQKCAPPQTKDNYFAKYYVLLLIPFLAALMVVMYSTARTVVVPLAVICIIVLTSSVVYTMRSSMVNAEYKRKMWFVALPLLVCVVKLLWALGVVQF